ncbi:MAG: type 4a pilus biogenesis protein PilO [Candidatus Omnitrophota bacterium]
MKVLSKLSKREKIFLYITAGLIAGSLGFKFIFEPLLRLSDRLNQKLKVSQSQLRRLQRLSSGKPIKEDYELSLASIKMAKSADAEMARLFGEIESMAKDAGVNILNLRPQEIEDKKVYKKFSLELKSEGTSKQILQFVFLIESSPLLLKIDRFQLAANASSKGLLSASLTLSRLAIP